MNSQSVPKIRRVPGLVFKSLHNWPFDRGKLRFMSLLRSYCGEDPVWMPLRCGYVIALKPNDKYQSKLVMTGEWEPSVEMLVRRLLRTGMTVVDVGASIGVYTMRFAKLVGPTGRVIAFEPSPFQFSLLSKAVRRNRVEEFVEIHQMALSDEQGRLTLHVSTERNRGLCTFGEPYFDHEGVEVSVTTLDSFASDRGLSSIALIKVDVEGWESAVFKGARQVLTRWCSPVLVFEANPRRARRAGTTLAALIDLLESFGYLLHEIEGDGSVSPGQYLFRSDDDPQINLVGIPRLRESEILEQVASRHGPIRCSDDG